MGWLIVPETVRECAVVIAYNAAGRESDDPGFALIRAIGDEWYGRNPGSEFYPQPVDTPTALGLALAYALRETAPTDGSR